MSGPLTVDELLARARAGLERLCPEAAARAMEEGAVLVDIRPPDQRERDGVVPGSVHVPRNVLEWRADPRCPARDPRIADPAKQVILMCAEGYQSSLAAATLQQLGLERATDLDGGFTAWRERGLPIERG